VKSVPNDVTVFILTKNEQQNIRRCLEALSSTDWKVVVLDSGSIDNTQLIVSEFENVEFRTYAYVNHCIAYNEITTSLAAASRYVVVLDADMVVSDALYHEIALLIDSEDAPEVIESQIMMCVEGLPLKYGSLCPPKACAFATGKSYFISSGHAEKLRSGQVVVQTTEKLRHDDRKSFASYLASQLRYAQNLVARSKEGNISFRDRIRTKTPLLIFVVPLISFVLKKGFMNGRAGGLYAIDRLIAEAIMYRQSLLGGATKTSDEII
jgi:glycosyltransferase involved in cell wall biosynthesis